MPTGADSLNTAVARFRVVVRLPDLDDRVWDARLICGGEKEKDKAGQTSTSSAIGNAERPDGGNTVPCQAAERATDPEEGEGNGRKRGGGAGMGLVAIALAHNSVEVSLTCYEQTCALIYSAMSMERATPCRVYLTEINKQPTRREKTTMNKPDARKKRSRKKLWNSLAGN